jgi:hypothetical protein
VDVGAECGVRLDRDPAYFDVLHREWLRQVLVEDDDTADR